MLIEYSKADIGYNQTAVLEQIDFSLNQGEFVFLTGNVGSGKTTFLKSLYAEAKIFSAQKAQVLGFDMLNIKTRFIPKLRRKIGFVFQDFKFLTDRSVYQNLRFVLRATGWKIELSIKRRIKEVLKTVGMLEYIDAMPYQLSGGQQQKIAIARAILNSPALLLADEPTGNLDPDTSRQIIDLLFKLSTEGTGVIVATHDTMIIEHIRDVKIYKAEKRRLILNSS